MDINIFWVSGLPLLVGTSLMLHQAGATLAIPLITATAAITAYWIQNRWDKAFAQQEWTLKEAELVEKLDKLNLLSPKQKARVLHARKAFQNPSLIALLSNS